MRPKRGSFKKYIKKIEGKEIVKGTLLPNGFHIGERVYYLGYNNEKVYGTVIDKVLDNDITDKIYRHHQKESIVWCLFDDGHIWFNYVEDTYHETE